MQVKNIIELDYSNYKKASMFIATCKCDWKCCTEQKMNKSICQNSALSMQENIEIPIDEIFNRYSSNPLTKAIVIGGLEPFLQFEEIYNLIKYFRENNCEDDFVIYTGYYLYEIEDYVKKLKQFNNIILKVGRYVPTLTKRYDELLGVDLISNNQYGIKIS